jgi:phage terminase Nu1 subunit (DNA packaging protein)
MGQLNEYYRARAAECERQAEETKDERTREQYRMLAEHWRLLAEQFEKHGL